MIRGKTEVADGIVIGEVMPFSGTLLYGGRPQGGTVHAGTTGEVMDALKSRMDELKEEFRGICYDTGEQWTIRANW